MDDERLKAVEEKLALDPNNIGFLTEASHHYHRLAMEGDSLAFKKAEDAVRKILGQDSTNVEALSILGSLLVIKAKSSSSLPKRIWYAISAARKLDRAVRIDPTNPSARTIRAFTSLVLPSFLKRIKRAIEDFEYLIEMKRNDPKKLPDEMMPKVYFNLGLAYAKSGNRKRAIEVLRSVVSLFPDTRECTRAKNLIARLER